MPFDRVRPYDQLTPTLQNIWVGLGERICREVVCVWLNVGEGEEENM